VPTGLKRYYGAGDLHFITCSCYQRPILSSSLLIIFCLRVSVPPL